MDAPSPLRSRAEWSSALILIQVSTRLFDGDQHVPTKASTHGPVANEWIVELESEGKPRSKGKRWMMKGGCLVDSKGRATNSCGVVFRFAKMKSRASSELRRRRNTNSGLLLAYRVVPGNCCSATVGSSIHYGSCMGTQGIVCTCSYLVERGADCSDAAAHHRQRPARQFQTPQRRRTRPR